METNKAWSHANKTLGDILRQQPNLLQVSGPDITKGKDTADFICALHSGLVAHYQKAPD